MTPKKVSKALSLVAGKTGYNWKFANVGGATRVSITSGEDIAHLGELDQKMWTVLSCPVKGLEIDEHTLQLMDADYDGKIRVNEILATASWLTSVLKNPDDLLKQEDRLPLSAINQENEAGMRLYASARQVLSYLNQERDEISVADTADMLAIFAQTRFNGDGVITGQTCGDETLAALVAACMQVEGSVPDRSGEPGVQEEQLEAFFTHCREFVEWKALASSENGTLPYGERTAEAYAAYQAVREKVEDYYIRCRFAAFNEEAVPTLDVSLTALEGIVRDNLTERMEEIASYPLARVRKDGELPLQGGWNPAWEQAFFVFKQEVLDVEFPQHASLAEAEWKQEKARFRPYEEWLAAKKGGEVEGLDAGLLQEALQQGRQDALRSLIAQDKALETAANDIHEVDKLLHYYRDFYVLLKNFITFSDFYSRDKGVKAIFQAGTLYIDQRSCDLCMKVTDMPKHNLMAALSGMFLIYCECRSKSKNETMTIVAAMTDGDIDDLREGKNAIFYDRSGLDWDATVVKIIDNPISVRQAFWSPYRKMGRFVNEQISKFASEKDNQVTSEMTSKISNAGTQLSETPADSAAAQPVLSPAAKTKQAFDISKFLGLFAVLGMALGTICGFMLDLLTAFFKLKWYKMIGVFVALMLIISGPSMLLAWLKLRKRDLAPLLNANGWAVNAKVLVNIVFGPTLTKIASFPALSDPFARKGVPVWAKVLMLVLFIAAVFAVLYFTNCLSFMGLRFR
ncbi:MAG: hypothetical protein J5873_06975 [Bacteroidales bacterium]|nr:hypothetical protein [Bacteroidales bacterium]